MLNNQKNATEQLKLLASSNSRSILLCGCPGCGKTYLALEYGDFVGCINKIVVSMKVDELRECVESCQSVTNDVLVVVENIDSGSYQSPGALLKFLEEPPENVYIVVTCSNIGKVPDTIVSRSKTVDVNHPTVADVLSYASLKYPNLVDMLSQSRTFKSVRSYKDVDYLSRLGVDKLHYMDSLNLTKVVNTPVATSLWELSHFPDESKTNLALVIQSLMTEMSDPYDVSSSITFLNKLDAHFVSENALLAKLLFELKYGG